MNNTLVYYVRKGNNVPIATLVAKKYSIYENIYAIGIGWSICSKGDMFVKKIGIENALIRIQETYDELYLGGSKMEIPRSLEKDFLIFADRAKTFFRCNAFMAKFYVKKEVQLDV